MEEKNAISFNEHQIAYFRHLVKLVRTLLRGFDPTSEKQARDLVQIVGNLVDFLLLYPHPTKLRDTVVEACKILGTSAFVDEEIYRMLSDALMV